MYKALRGARGKGGAYTGTYTVVEGDNDAINAEATNITLTGGDGTSAANVVPLKQPDPKPDVGRYDAFAEAGEADSPPAEAPAPKKPARKKSSKAKAKSTAKAIGRVARS